MPVKHTFVGGKYYQAIGWQMVTDLNPANGKHDATFNSLRPSDAYMRQWISHLWFRVWLVAWPAPSHYLNQCWNMVNSHLRNKLQWILKRNSYIFTHENAFENIVCEMAAILYRPQCVNVKNSDQWTTGCSSQITVVTVGPDMILFIQSSFCLSK